MRLRGDEPPLGSVPDLVAAHGPPLLDPSDLDPVLERVGEARHVLIGEASHGTHEYYAWRAELTRRLVVEKGFRFVAVEGDWPDCRHVDAYVRGESDADRPSEALAQFARWPTWMWANRDVEAFVGWLRAHNDALPPAARVGFHGLDVYSLWESLEAVIGYLAEHEHPALEAAWRAVACFEPYGRDEQRYAAATAGWVPATCEDEVVALLSRLRGEGLRHDGSAGFFDAEQNALVARNAERYYRAMVRGGPGSWNVRDRHMTETLERLMRRYGAAAKCVVWEHNTHVGDARHTDMAGAGLVNVGQLVREAHPPDDVVVVGFGGHRGTVLAGRAWGARAEPLPVPPAREGSWEDVFQEAAPEDRLLVLDALREAPAALAPRGHRAIGVVYEPAREAYGNYVPSVLPLRYDVFLHFDRTRALEPLPVPARLDEVPETYPFRV